MKIIASKHVDEKICKELLLASVWAAIENVLLAATAISLGICVYTTLDNDEKAILREILGISPIYRIATVFQLGYVDEVVTVTQRKSGRNRFISAFLE